MLIHENKPDLVRCEEFFPKGKAVNKNSLSTMYVIGVVLQTCGGLGIDVELVNPDDLKAFGGEQARKRKQKGESESQKRNRQKQAVIEAVNREIKNPQAFKASKSHEADATGLALLWFLKENC